MDSAVFFALIFSQTRTLPACSSREQQTLNNPPSETPFVNRIEPVFPWKIIKIKPRPYCHRPRNAQTRCLFPKHTFVSITTPSGFRAVRNWWVRERRRRGEGLEHLEATGFFSPAICSSENTKLERRYEVKWGSRGGRGATSDWSAQCSFYILPLLCVLVWILLTFLLTLFCLLRCCSVDSGRWSGLISALLLSLPSNFFSVCSSSLVLALSFPALIFLVRLFTTPGAQSFTYQLLKAFFFYCFAKHVAR